MSSAERVKILFLCVANAARSQIAEGLARKFFGARAEIQSAGSQSWIVHPMAIEVMREIGIDISTHRSKSINDLSPEFISSVNYVVTLCADEVCPVLPKAVTRLHWPQPDPVGGATEDAMLKRFRLVRDALQFRLEAWVREEFSFRSSFDQNQRK
jgi:arsenate reductase